MLDNVEFNAYIQKTIAFARTIVIKCEDLALLDNRLMEQYYGINSGTDKSKWRYYLHLNGEYHSTDEIMKVQSLDNGDVIDFTKANLDIHPATKRAYRLGSYYYTRLTEKYPAQSNLINGIINPIPPSESIPANNYQILRYNKDYVLWNEYQLIPALQEHINTMVLTSFKTEYLYTDNLMLTILLGNLYASLVSAILMIREEAEGTRYVHEFHIWSKLTSHGISPIYKSVLDNKQTMWLYRNIDWVLRKQGRIQTFDSLVDIILTHRNIPLARHEALQTTTDQLDNLVPTPAFISRPVNLQNRLGLSSRMLTVSELIVKENKVAIDNAQEESYSIATAEYNISTGVHSDIPTKVLESTMVDATDRNPNTIMRVLHNHWIYLAANDIYQINHDFVDFRSGTRFKLSTKDAYILWAYLLDRNRKTTQEHIPAYTYFNVRKILPPNYLVLMGLGDKDILTEDVAKDILKVTVEYSRIISPDVFFLKAKEIFDKQWDHRKLYSRVLNLFTHTRVKNAVESLYETGAVKLTNKTRYKDWLTRLELNFDDYSEDDCLELAWNIWKKVTGWENAAFMTIADQQKQLINLMKDLTSYTVQYIGSTTEGEVEGQIQLMDLVDSDIWSPNSETGLESDNKDQLVLDALKGTKEASLTAKEHRGSPEGNMVDHLEIESIGSGDIPINSYLKYVETEPDFSPFHLNVGLRLREAV
ncbi:hypothetical protein PS2_0122 [Aeromonas phage PS2]|uniref:Virion structural protein n=2 Tax=root TaxID=1 RepID=A0A514TV28_9CAUD|nr:hypothetical protein PQC64_gp141 [Aeromonas phage PS1]QDJ96881.1 hypothetical protein PS1_0122 [Aeromonas phage PS1]QFR59513.1 hypothetical protein PS2_0122 [Aeromonas phage PS2]